MSTSAEIFVGLFGSSPGAACKPTLVDWEYTHYFHQEMRQTEALKYHRKFQIKFEKNVKHRQQVAMVRKYLREETEWLDAPIGSGRLMDELRIGKQTGFDKSPAFLDFNRSKGRTVIEGDLLDFGFRDRYDLITTLHTLPAFSNYKAILVSLVRALRPGGVLIVDVNNARHVAAIKKAGLLLGENSGMNRKEIPAFFARLGCEVAEIVPHDYFDSPFVNRFYRIPGYRLVNLLYFKLRLFPLFDTFSRNRREHHYTKYLVAVRKVPSPYVPSLTGKDSDEA